MHTVKRLENGVTLVYERMPSLRSAALGIWVASGTRHEPPELNGISHYIEHMLFKGTARTDAAGLARRMDMLGGEVNAFTSKECTCYYCRVPDEDLKSAARLLAEMFFESSFSEESMELERGVILEEIGMVEDSPEEHAADLLLQGIFRGGPLGLPILGTRESLERIDGAAARGYRAGRYTGPGIVLALAGSFSDSDLDCVCELFQKAPDLPRPEGGPSEYSPFYSGISKPTEQSHIVLAFPGLSYKSEKRFELSVLNSLLGGGMSSRLFQRVRERLGLCYSIYSFLSSHQETGAVCVYVGTGKKTEREAVTEIGREIASLLSGGISDDELTKIKHQSRASMLMALESTSSRMNHMGKSLLLRGEIVTPEQTAEIISGIRAPDLSGLASDIFTAGSLSVSAVAPGADPDKYREWFAGGLVMDGKI